MKFGVIDIGSNTIRTVVYETDGAGFQDVLNEKSTAGLISYVQDGVLTPVGIRVLLDALTSAASLCRLTGCDEIHCFATASLRDAGNFPEVAKQVYAETGLTMRLISGAEEAWFDFSGLRHEVADEAGVGMDLGGGSGQIFAFAGDTLTHSVSLPIGCLLLYNRFVGQVMPTKAERKHIKHYVKSELKKAPEIKALGHLTLYTTGGTARAAAKLHRALTGGTSGIPGYRLTLEDLETLVRIVDNMGLTGVRLISQTIPDRINTILPGMISLRTVCRYVGAKEIRIVKSGVREGYVWETIMQTSKNSS